MNVTAMKKATIEDEMPEEARLARIENKLDRLADAVVSLARMEERMVTLFKRTDMTDETLRDVERRIAEIERLDIGRSQFFRVFDKLAWMVIGILIAFAAKLAGLG